jgi:hypothetical protein
MLPIHKMQSSKSSRAAYIFLPLRPLRPSVQIPGKSFILGKIYAPAFIRLITRITPIGCGSAPLRLYPENSMSMTPVRGPKARNVIARGEARNERRPGFAPAAQQAPKGCNNAHPSFSSRVAPRSRGMPICVKFPFRCGSAALRPPNLLLPPIANRNVRPRAPLLKISNLRSALSNLFKLPFGCGSDALPALSQ